MKHPVTSWIEQSHKKGYSRKQIHSALAKRGYADHHIRKFYSDAKIKKSNFLLNPIFLIAFLSISFSILFLALLFNGDDQIPAETSILSVEDVPQKKFAFFNKLEADDLEQEAEQLLLQVYTIADFPKTDFGTYSNIENGIYLRYPADWDLGVSGRYGLVFAIPLKEGKFEIKMDSFSQGSITPNSALQAYVNSEGVGKELEIIGFFPSELAQSEAEVAIYTIKSGNDVMKRISVLTFKNGKMYVVNLIVPVKNFDSLLPITTAVIDSVNFA